MRKNITILDDSVGQDDEGQGDPAVHREPVKVESHAQDYI